MCEECTYVAVIMREEYTCCMYCYKWRLYYVIISVHEEFPAVPTSVYGACI
jgi:hypothetical protein